MGILGLGRTVKMYTNLFKKKKKLVWTKLFQKKKKFPRSSSQP